MCLCKACFACLYASGSALDLRLDAGHRIRNFPALLCGGRTRTCADSYVTAAAASSSTPELHHNSHSSLLAAECQQSIRIFHREIAIRFNVTSAIGCDDLRQHKSCQQCGGRFRLANGRLDGLDEFVLWRTAWLAGFFVHDLPLLCSVYDLNYARIDSLVYRVHLVFHLCRVF